MRFQVTLTSKAGTRVISECKRPGAAQAMFDRACIETQDWVASKAEKNVRVVTGRGEQKNTFVVVMLAASVVASWTVALVDSRPAPVEDDLSDALAASLIAVNAGAL